MYRYGALPLLLAMATTVRAADSCPPAAALPPGWQALYTRALIVHVPPGANAQQLPSDDTQADTIRIGGMTLQVERGMPYLVAPREDVPPGNWPLRFTAAAAGRPAGLAATWNLDNAGRDIARLHLNFRDSRERELACRIAAGARPLGRSADLRLLRIVAAGKRRCALLRDGELQRRVCAGDYVTRHYGQVERIHAGSIVIRELFMTDSGGWRDERTTLTPSGQ